MSPQAFFLPAENGQRFCLFYPAQLTSGKSPLGQVLYVHPFSEEMNKSRRMVAMQVRALAQIGFDVLQIDLLGCGDSSGDFGDASWTAWINDVVLACQWLRNQAKAENSGTPRPPLWLWGLRAGCLLAAQAASALQEPCNFLFWAPTPVGKPLLQQFLRLKAAADLASGNAKAVMDSLRSNLASGRPVEVAGYRLAPALAIGLDEATLKPPTKDIDRPCKVVWFDISTRVDASFSPVASKSIFEWKQAGFTLESRLINGPSFWQTTEIEDAPALIFATTKALQEACPI
jgi:exosortase A-associated hydrolase 2